MKKLLLPLAALLPVATAAATAAAQADVNPPLPNVLLVVDTSGSMEFKTAPNAVTGDPEFPTCSPTISGSSTKSRWVDLIEVLTGSIQDYRCDAVDRSSSTFRTEYALGAVDPYDYGYNYPYHRPLSGTCTPGPGSYDLNNAFLFPPDAIRFHEYDSTATSCASFQQGSDGLIDSFRLSVRFGLMTFDTLSEPGTGYDSTTNDADFVSGTSGLWSYFAGTQPRRGWPEECLTEPYFELGARNGAAPAWEGKLVNFGDPNPTEGELEKKNQQVQQVLLATRPFGGTPIAGALHDARDFLQFDTRNDPAIEPPASPEPYGPESDPYIRDGCRKNYIILLTDGEPNLDLRPFCVNDPPPAPGVCTKSGTDGCCPYQQPEDIAYDLAHPTNPNEETKTFVIGFALDEVDVGGTTVDCSTLTESDLQAGGICEDPANESNKPLQACCNLNRIAFAGETGNALFASDVAELRSAISAVLSDIASRTTSRTLPVFGSGSTVTAARFFSSFVPKQFEPWEGVLERQRYECVKDPGTGIIEPVAQEIDPNEGDDFINNVERNAASRRFYSVRADLDGAVRHSARTIRPGTINDGVGIYGGTGYDGGAAAFIAATQPTAMSVTAASCGGASAGECRDLYLEWLLGLDNGSGDYHRCRTPETCNLIGDIFRSTPTIVGPPRELIQDESYEAFARVNATRKTVLYTSTNDGFLHAFDVDAADASSSNELWAFIPPAVLPEIPSLYPPNRQMLLDGVAVVRDVIATPDGSGGFELERLSSNARAGNTTWRTILVQSFGEERPGFFALDVTEPDPATGSGPRFLWQLVTDDAGNALFGNRGTTPLITTVFLTDPADGDNKEVAVAVLPGGNETSTGPSCPRARSSWPDVAPEGQPRPSVRCYGSSRARSLTIVRLDNGEILKTFRRDLADVPAGLAGEPSRINLVDIDSPISGTPAAYPGEPGSIADRLFVGDADGTLWKVDVSSPDPDDWEMVLFFDAYSGAASDAGQPIVTAPVLSVDTAGQITVAFSTGSQTILTAQPGMENFVYSLTEADTGTALESELNWFVELVDGERVAGPITLFNGSLFFSSYTPESTGSTNVCGTGNSRVWGMDYITPKEVADRSQGGLERLPEDQSATPTLVQFIDNTSTLLDEGATIFGVSVARLPTCNEEVSTSDPFFGTGVHTSITNVNPGQFQLVMQTGTSGSSVAGGQTNSTAINLPAPPSTPRIDSWAAILD